MTETLQEKTIILTGGCGFIGHHLVESIINNTNCKLIIIDKLSYSSMGLKRLETIGVLNNPRISLLTYDISNPISEGVIHECKDAQIIIHMAAETHVDKSISEPVSCIKNNIMSTTYLLEFARKLEKLEKFLYFSTDEVYGPAINVDFIESDCHNPTNPYSASKSASEQICLSYLNTYKLPIIICNVMNVYGERQYAEKYIPLCINKLLNNEPIIIHAYSDCIKPGSRHYIHAKQVANAVCFILTNGKIGEKYNITGEKEVDNLELAQKISDIIDKPLEYKLIDFDNDRPGHDVRYALNGSKLEKLGWKPNDNFDDSLKKMVLWTLNNRSWLEL